MKIKKEIEMNRHKAMLEDLERMYQNNEISEQTYQEMQQKYQEKLKELEERLEEEGEELYLELDELGEDMGELGIRISEKVNAAVAKAMEKVHQAISHVPDSFEFEAGESYSAEDVYEGSFDSDEVEIDFSTCNGRIELEGWDEDTYKVVVRKKVRSYSEEKAQEKLEKVQLNFEHLKNGKDILQLNPEEHNATVSVKAYLPGRKKGGMLSKDRDIKYNLNLDNVNGRILVRGISTGKAGLSTTNGRIEIVKVNADILDAQTMNGRIVVGDAEIEIGSLSTENGRLELTNAKGERLTGSTDNGSIHGKMSFEHAELKTDTGSIRIAPQGIGEYQLRTDVGSISLDIEKTVPYHIDAATGMGKVRTAPDFERVSHNKRKAILESKTYEGPKDGLTVRARTDLGSIRVR